ncbi:MAG: ABC transporter permease [Solirubrobacterales bacterium]|nr:ABC transporter permease [Solirubrobacterales bacterium]MCB8969350.1 ABC transporter permease [Thermoleophilales bacterium]MCO5327812.1 ABC transporter permease [Solirubrobacterales bacterium]
MSARQPSLIARWLPPLLLVALLLGLWELAAQTGWIADALSLRDYLVPAPSEIATTLWDNRSLLAENAWVTLREVLLGFAVALVAGVLIAVLLHLSPLMRRASYPFIVASQAIPIVVIAPVLVVWFGFGIGPKVAIVALICFFPIVVNTLDGLGTADEEQRKLMRSLGASRGRTLTLLEAPTALPYLLSGAKIAVAVAVIGAVFGEWSGADAGLGYLIRLDDGNLEVARVFASTVILAAMAVTLFALLALVERRLAWWGAGSPGGGR